MAEASPQQSSYEELRHLAAVAIRLARNRRFMTQVQFGQALAPRVGKPTVHPSTISRWESPDEDEPAVTVLLAAAEVAGLTVGDLLTRAEEKIAEELRSVAEQIAELERQEEGGSDPAEKQV